MKTILKALIILSLITLIIFPTKSYAHGEQTAGPFALNGFVGYQYGIGTNGYILRGFDANLVIGNINGGYSNKTNFGSNAYIGIGIGSALQIQYGFSYSQRKNLLRLIRAHESLPNQLAKEYPLVIAGKLAWDDGLTLQTIHKGIEDKRCIWVNYVDDNQKRSLLQSCQGMAFVSLYEGFGLPVLEAFASEAPVITSNCTSMPEVAGDCALLVDPLNIDSIQTALLQLIEDKLKVKDLKEQGLQRAKQFTWIRVAEQTKNVYKLFI